MAARLFTGKPFPASADMNLQIGGATLGRIVIKLGGDETSLYSAYRKYGDLGTAARDVLTSTARESHELSLAEILEIFYKIAGSSGLPAKSALLERLLMRSAPQEAKYLNKLVSGDLRIGLREILIEEAIARSHETDLIKVRRANMLLGNISETLILAATGGLDETQNTLRPFKPVGMMLASPVDSVGEGAKKDGPL